MTMTPITPSFHLPAGKQNALTSLNKWLETWVPTGDFTYVFNNEMQPSIFPRVEVSEFQYFDKGNIAMGQVLFPSNPSGGGTTEGIQSQSMIEVNIYDSIAKNKSAKKFIYELRDRITYALRNAGRTSDLGDVERLPAIEVFAYNAGGGTTNTFLWCPIEDDNFMLERYFGPTAEAPDVHRIQLLFKVNWYELNLA